MKYSLVQFINFIFFPRIFHEGIFLNLCFYLIFLVFYPIKHKIWLWNKIKFLPNSVIFLSFPFFII